MTDEEKNLSCPLNNLEIPSFSRVRHPVTGETMLLPLDIGQEDFEDALAYEAGDSDIFICTYSKSGTTWVQTIVWLMVHNGEPIPGKIRHSMPMLEFDGARGARKIDNSVFPRIIKTHLPQSWTPHNPNAKYVCVVREAKDVLVSYFYHCKGYPEHYACPDLNFDRLFELFLDGSVDFGSYFDHVSAWFAKRNEPNVLFLLYEDLKKDIRGEILKLGKFLGYEEALLADGERLLNVVIDGSSIESMRKQSNKWSIAKRVGNIPIIRKGIVGDWKNHLSEVQRARMDKRVKEKGEDAGWASLWDEHKIE